VKKKQSPAVLPKLADKSAVVISLRRAKGCLRYEPREGYGVGLSLIPGVAQALECHAGSVTSVKEVVREFVTHRE